MHNILSSVHYFPHVSEISDYNNSLANMVNLIGSNNRTVIINKEIIVDADLVIPENISLIIMQEAKITINAGVTLTITGNCNIGIYPVFEVNGNLYFSITAVKEAVPEWFYDTEDYMKINRAIECSINVRLLAKTYNITDTIILQDMTNLYGAGYQTVLDTSAQITMSGFSLKNINLEKFVINGISPSALTGIALDMVDIAHISKITVQNLDSGLTDYAEGIIVNDATQVKIDNCILSFIGGAVHSLGAIRVTAVSRTPENIRIINNHIDNSKYGILLKGQTGAINCVEIINNVIILCWEKINFIEISPTIYNLAIKNNVFKNGFYGIRTSSAISIKNFMLENNYFEDNTGTILLLYNINNGILSNNSYTGVSGTGYTNYNINNSNIHFCNEYSDLLFLTTNPVYSGNCKFSLIPLDTHPTIISNNSPTPNIGFYNNSFSFRNTVTTNITDFGVKIPYVPITIYINDNYTTIINGGVFDLKNGNVTGLNSAITMIWMADQGVYKEIARN